MEAGTVGLCVKGGSSGAAHLGKHLLLDQLKSIHLGEHLVIYVGAF